ncbi:carbohydate-binding domain-containing protein, partial [Vibrio cholerae]
GETVTLPLIGEYWTLFDTDFMPRAFVTAPDVEPKVIAALNTEDVASFVSGLEGENLKRTPSDNNVFAQALSRFEKNSDVALQDVTHALIPTPLQV